MTQKFETVCITRQGFNFAHTEGADFAAKVTYLRYEPGQIHDDTGIIQERLFPLPGTWK
jgi:hypothetical protein